MEEIDLRIKDVVVILAHKWKMIFSITIVIILVIGIASFFVMKPVYEVNTKVFIGKEESNRAEYNNSDVIMYENLMETYSELIKANDLIKNAIDKNNLEVTPEEVSNSLKITPVTDTQILQISYQNQDSALAKNVITSVVEEFIHESKELIPNGTVTVIESAELPEEPVSPNKFKNILVACIAGIIFGSGLALLLEYMDDTFKTKEQIEKVIEIPVIGVIPCEEKKCTSKKKHIKRKDKSIKESILYEN